MMRSASTDQNIRKSAIAGTWYPGRAAELTRMVDDFLAAVPETRLPGKLIGLISPHAGYFYSGQVAAYAYKQVQGLRFDVVAVVSPVHRMYVGPLMVNDCDYYETPLGWVEVDTDLVRSLEERIGLSHVRRDDEHSLEIQLPFLQRVLGSFKLLPIMQGDQSLATCQALAEALADVIQSTGQDRSSPARALLVASTDLSHFHSYEAARRLDSVAASFISNYDPVGLSQALQNGSTEACGGGPVISVMLTARALGATHAQILHYANSGDVTGDRTRVVGYLAAALYQRTD
jgi:AmmeMemoRadiSam system protein B